jgi:hypothetical protein
MRKTIAALVLGVMVLSSHSVAFAWDDAGHKITAWIAWNQMTPPVRAKVSEILLTAPEDSHLSAYFATDSRSLDARQRELFMIASTWPDIVRDRRFPNRYQRYHRGNWHYINTFWKKENGKFVMLELQDVDAGRATEKLYEFEKAIADPNLSDADKAIAIAWILHIIGDIHQPLHASGRVTEQEPRGDLGGNLFLLTPEGTPRDQQVNLHWFWDSIVGRNVPREHDACDDSYLPQFVGGFWARHPAVKYSDIKDGKFDEWQLESVRLAMEEVFPDTLVRNQMPSDEYKRNAMRVSEERIALAGHRIAAMLNRIFGS